ERLLAEGDAVLAVEEAVVGGEEDQRVVELASLAQRLDDRADRLVDREEGLPALLPVLPDRSDLALVEQRPAPDRERLVGDVGLVERRRHRQRLVREGVTVPGRGRRRADEGVVRIGWFAGMRGEERDPEEERLLVRRAATDDLVCLVAQKIGLIAGRLLGRTVRRQLPVLVRRVAVVAVRRVVDEPVTVARLRMNLGRVPCPVLVQVLAET